MLHHLGHMIDSFHAQPPPPAPAEQIAVAIRRAHDADAPLLHDLAELDSVKPLAGPVLVAVVEGRIWAAIGLDDDRVVADPFLPTAPAVELLALRVRQLRVAGGRPARRLLPRWAAGRARA
ncbi:MAG: hypothetical protein AVDCRST_MAG67-4190 [uncultured Solirubrobacteraceae bacterium]|uniref:Uncharacterized protein n=1 Tax=uncultured Solirubrobacteraceae bacterium TaxID=1162706 RepID=A0A6J4TMX9_9ACTN|nr:MAG: hypothetical protein AVDCRST_MAG67-4190 [uncultured Solirubrobacteraceae bacterium]